MRLMGIKLAKRRGFYRNDENAGVIRNCQCRDQTNNFPESANFSFVSGSADGVFQTRTMKTKILYIERKLSESVSIERVFRQVAENLSKEKFAVFFDRLLFPNDTWSTFKNLLFYRKPLADIYHITGHIHYIALIFPVKNTILTVHDVRILYIRRGIRRFVLKKMLLDFPIRRLKYITAISEATKKEIIRYTKCDEKKIRVIENPLPSSISPEKIKKFNSACPTILQIGTTDNKNLENLIEALEGINCRLKIVGRIGAPVKKLLNDRRIDYENAYNLNDSEIRSEYEKADLVAFCSTYEGFGLPVIEAQAMGKPLITSNIEPLKEVAGGAAVLIEPSDVSSIRNGILELINNADLRKNLVNKGFENVKRFAPTRISEMYENLYLEVLENSRM